MIPHYTSPDWPVWLIETAQEWLLAAAYSYNHEEVEFASDWIYDASVRELQRYKDRYPEQWALSPVCPEVFIHDDAWQYTSQHFPKNEEVKGWLEGYRRRFNEATTGVVEEPRCKLTTVGQLSRARHGDNEQTKGQRMLF